MAGLLTVIPVVNEPTTDVCIESILRENSAAGLSKDEILLVDNSRKGFAEKYGLRVYRDPDGHNLGVARSWNIGAREVMEKGLDYLVLMSASMCFGPELHTTWKKQMETFWGEDVIECDGHSWHLIAIHRRLFEKVGLFDTNFYPAYEESIDWCYRLSTFDLEGGWPRPWVNAMSQSVAHGINSEGISSPNRPLRKYYVQKWGGPKGQEEFTLPFEDKPIDFFYERSIPALAADYGLKEWW